MRKIELTVSPEKAISLDRPVVTVKSHINYHGAACTEIEIKSKNKISNTKKQR
jgi:hypothetical protein